MTFVFQARIKKRMADIDTPHSIYLKLRDECSGSILLEHVNRGAEPGYSYICCYPVAGFVVASGTITEKYPDGQYRQTVIRDNEEVSKGLTRFLEQFHITTGDDCFNTKGLFGHINYDAVRYFETIQLSAPQPAQKTTADIQLCFYSTVLVFDHLTNTCHCIAYVCDGEATDNLALIEQLMDRQQATVYPFSTTGDEYTNTSDDDFLDMVARGKEHCYQGDVFQIVLSRSFAARYQGDDFNVYRALRSVNPSPYMFYADYGAYRLLGASPEAQLIVSNGRTTIHPIAGTYRRTGNEEQDRLLAEALKADRKENAEHVMLVDLARNDLSKHCRDVSVAVYKEIRQYSHVLHLVSEVSGTSIATAAQSLKILMDTFPAGTLTGAPKYRAMQLIDTYEPEGRGYYGGCMGFLGFNGDVSQAIMIRTFLSKGNTLYYRAGAGITAASAPESEITGDQQ